VASSRLDQCVTPNFFGGGFNVVATILLWSIVRGRPDRASSDSPPIPQRAYRVRQLVTVGRDTPTRAAISTLVSPVGGEQHDPRPLGQPGLDRRGPQPALQPFTVPVPQGQRRCTYTAVNLSQ
jgi:hypothetical protein